jgi:hypothetical protein
MAYGIVLRLCGWIAARSWSHPAISRAYARIAALEPRPRQVAAMVMRLERATRLERVNTRETSATYEDG